MPARGVEGERLSPDVLAGEVDTIRELGVEFRLNTRIGKEPSLDELMHKFVESEQIKIGQIIHAVRVAVTGKMIGFGLFETLTILGRQSCLARLDRALGRL